MDSSFEWIENDYFNDESSSLCSSCKSLLHSICSIGVPSFSEHDDEVAVKTEIEETVDNGKNIGTVRKDAQTSDNRVKEQKLAKNAISYSIAITARPGKQKMQEASKKSDREIGCSAAKKIKYIDPLHKVNTSSSKIISNERASCKNSLRDIITYSKKITSANRDPEENKLRAWLSNVTNEKPGSTRPNLERAANYETREAKISRTKKNSANNPATNLSVIKPRNNDSILKSIANHRKNINRTIESILHLCRHMSTMSKAIVEAIEKIQF